MNGKLFFDAANAAEPEALEVLERFCKMVAVQIYNLTVLLDVEKVAIGGGISKQPLLLDDLRRVYAGLFASRGESPYMIGSAPAERSCPAISAAKPIRWEHCIPICRRKAKPFNGFRFALAIFSGTIIFTKQTPADCGLPEFAFSQDRAVLENGILP